MATTPVPLSESVAALEVTLDAAVQRLLVKESLLDGKVAAANSAASNAAQIETRLNALPGGSGSGLSTEQAAKLASVAQGATANAADSVLKDRANHTGTQGPETVTGLAVALTKLGTVAQGATANAADALLRDRSTHTGAQAIGTVTGLTEALAGKQAALTSGTNIKTVGNVSLLGSGNIPFPTTVAAAPATQTLAFASTVQWNAAQGTVASLQLTGNATLALPTNLPPGQLTLFVIQDGVGGRTLSFGAGYYPSSVILAPESGATTVLDFRSNGTAMYRLGMATNTPPSVPVDAVEVPSAAFSGGASGAWFDAEPLSRFYSSASGSIVPMMYNSAFGRWLDRSGNNNHVAQADDAKRGYTHAFNGDAQHAGYMLSGMSASAGGGATTGFYLCVSARMFGSAGTYFSDVAGANTGVRLHHSNAVTKDLLVSVGTGSARTVADVASGTAVGAVMATAYTLEAWLSGGQLSIRKDGGEVTSVACANIAAGTAGFVLGALDAAGTDAANIDIFQLVYVKNSVPAAALRDAIGAFCAAKAGIAYASQAAVVAPVAAPAIDLDATSKDYLLQVGNANDAYWLSNNRWGKGSIVEGSGADQFSQEMGRSLTVGAGGEVAARMKWRWPNPPGSGQVKGYPAIQSGRFPGWYTVDGNVPGWEHPVKLPSGSILQTVPAGATPGTFMPLQLPIGSLKAKASFELTGATGKGHLSYDIWLQDRPQQYFGFTASPISHEIMIPLTNWGGYGGHPSGRNPNWYDHDVRIGGVLYHVYVTKGSDGRLLPNFGYLNGAFGRSGWKMIAFVPDVLPVPQGTVIDLAAILNYLSTRTDSAGTKWAQGNEHLVSVELGVEPEEGAGDLTIYNYKVAPTL